MTHHGGRGASDQASASDDPAERRGRERSRRLDREREKGRT